MRHKRFSCPAGKRLSCLASRSVLSGGCGLGDAHRSLEKRRRQPVGLDRLSRHACQRVFLRVSTSETCGHSAQRGRSVARPRVRSCPGGCGRPSIAGRIGAERESARARERERAARRASGCAAASRVQQRYVGVGARTGGGGGAGMRGGVAHEQPCRWTQASTAIWTKRYYAHGSMGLWVYGSIDLSGGLTATDLLHRPHLERFWRPYG
jgi:hypothetical protein